MNAVVMQMPPALPQHLALATTLPWVPLGEGKAFKPLAFFADDRGFVELLRLDPGVAIPLHRHTGEVHAYNLAGSRRLHTGEIIGPGDYVYEPAGNTDSWGVHGDEPLIVMVVVIGAVEYIDRRSGAVAKRYTASTLRELYREHCAMTGLPVSAALDVA
jgi:quercetin dioxygenase-like cupin family protein